MQDQFELRSLEFEYVSHDRIAMIKPFAPFRENKH